MLAAKRQQQDRQTAWRTARSELNAGETESRIQDCSEHRVVTARYSELLIRHRPAQTLRRWHARYPPAGSPHGIARSKVVKLLPVKRQTRLPADAELRVGWAHTANGSRAPAADIRDREGSEFGSRGVDANDGKPCAARHRQQGVFEPEFPERLSGSIWHCESFSMNALWLATARDLPLEHPFKFAHSA